MTNENDTPIKRHCIYFLEFSLNDIKIVDFFPKQGFY